MMKRNKWKLFISSVIILLPMIVALFHKHLPKEIAVHWGPDGAADGFMGAGFFFLIMPPVMLAVHWLCMFLEAVIDKKTAQNKKIMEFTYWIIPCISLLCSSTVLASALGRTNNMFTWILIFFAILFMYIGNYLPKTSRNRSTGIKIRWAQSNDDNWNATHRFAGKLFVALGILSLALIPLPDRWKPIVFVVLILACALIPTVYSYCFYRKQLAEGSVTREEYFANDLVKNRKLACVIGVGTTVVLAILFYFLMLTGDVNVVLEEASFTVEADFWQDMTLSYADVDTVEYRENAVDGDRIGGFGSLRLLLGNFRNGELGTYTRYTYTGDLPCIVITVDGHTVVFGTADREVTRAAYERILSEISQGR